MYDEEVFELPQDILDGLVSNVVEANEDTKSESPKEQQDEFELEITDDILDRLVNDTVGLLEQGQKTEIKSPQDDAQRAVTTQNDAEDKEDQTQKQAKGTTDSDRSKSDLPSERASQDRHNDNNDYGKLLQDTEALLQQFESSKVERTGTKESAPPVQETSDTESQQHNTTVHTNNSQQTEHQIESEVNFRDMLKLAEQHVQIDHLLSGTSEEISHEILEQLASATAESIQNQQKQLAKEFSAPKQQQLQREFLNRQKQQQRKSETSSDENLQEALANMVQSVVNNVVETSRNEKTEVSNSEVDTAKSGIVKSSESHDLDQTQLNQILENAVAMAITNPNNLLDSAPLSEDNKQSETSNKTPAITSQEALDAAKARLSKLPIKPMKRVEDKNKLSDSNTNSGSDVFNDSSLQTTGNSSLLEAIRNASQNAMKQIQEYRKNGSVIPSSKDAKTSLASSDMLANNQRSSDIDPLSKKSPLITATRDTSTKRGLSIAQTLAITRDQMVKKVSTEPQNVTSLYSSLSPNSSLYLQRQQMLNSMKTKPLEPIKSEPTESLPLLPATISAEVSRITGLSSDTIKSIFSTVNNSVDLIAPSLNRKSLEKANMDLKEKIRMDNRERKKRWRELNVDKNRDNDLRARVLKRASVLFPSADEEEKKKKWVQDEFTKRKQKRLERERENKPIYSAFETKKETNNKDNYKPNNELASTTDTVLKQFSNLGIPDDPKFVFNFTELCKTFQNSASAVYSSKNSLVNTATAAIVAYASLNQESTMKDETTNVSPKLASMINSVVSALLNSTPQDAAVKEITGLPLGAISSFKIRKDHTNHESSTTDAIKLPSKVPDAELTLLVKNKNSSSTNSNNAQMIGALRNLNLNFTTEKRKVDDVPIAVDDSATGKKPRTEDRKNFSAPWTFNTLKLPQYKKPEAGNKPVYSPGPPRLGQTNNLPDREASKSLTFGGINLRKPGAFRKPKTTTQ